MRRQLIARQLKEEKDTILNNPLASKFFNASLEKEQLYYLCRNFNDNEQTEPKIHYPEVAILWRGRIRGKNPEFFEEGRNILHLIEKFTNDVMNLATGAPIP